MTAVHEAMLEDLAGTEIAAGRILGVGRNKCNPKMGHPGKWQQDEHLRPTHFMIGRDLQCVHMWGASRKFHIDLTSARRGLNFT